MFFNIKMNTIIKIIGVLIICLTLLFISGFFKNMPIEMTNENYTKILKEYHDNPFKYEGKKIKTSGFVFRAKDFNDNQIVIARDMLIGNNESQIVGFLCEYNGAKDLHNEEWISAEGQIYIGNYYGTMPILKLSKIKKIAKPSNPFVNPPL